MGHSDIQVTAEIYTHMVDAVFKTNCQRLQQYNEFKIQQAMDKGKVWSKRSLPLVLYNAVSTTN